ncbi:DUF3871 family protein [Polaribacter dokdonensis]|uniref:DUF3871 domain containing protein n=1 Tax=Polaribacter dokdonensis DSW-5 TaxID=1300348 RepID=A0A0M9CGH5_9FLAO|nr:DUF3871 family protein [Polaribacter dokdonensis]KOY51689.1 DUF3871 domain containing protein [Polaribacter dokdonensis DSW-5]SEE05465.1 protein of unknown function [Polaribacter dokdonensis DSW-5]
MELIALNNNQFISEDEIVSNKSNFIEANTKCVTLNHIKKECIVPVYSDNNLSISHANFIEATKDVVNSVFSNEQISAPNIRVSHQIKGRVPSAINKTLKELLPHEKTIYYQRCAFIIEIPSLRENVNKNQLSLTIGGVRALNQENLYSKRTLEKFKVFIGYKNKVCTNLCVSTDGLLIDVRVGSIQELKQKIYELIKSFNKDKFLGELERISKFQLEENQFSHLIGKMKMYQFLNKEDKVDKLTLLMNDNQISTTVKNYYNDPNFRRDPNGAINLWQLYNLFTEANKSSYIDSNLERNVNTFEFVTGLANSLQNNTYNWFLTKL